MEEMRKQVAELADNLYVGALSYKQFMDSIPDEAWDDEDAAELIDMITHEPKVGGFLGVSKAEGEKNRNQILALIAKLQQ